MKKQIISLLLALVMVISLVPEAFAAGSSGKAAQEGKPQYLDFYPESGVVVCNDKSITEAVIPAAIGGIAVRTIGSRGFQDCTRLTSVTIPDSVTHIGEEAFMGCTGLEGITIPNSVTHLGACVFKNCTGLTDVVIPDSVKQTGWSVFEGCTGLTSATISKNLPTICGKLFIGCENLERVTIPSKVTEIENDAFLGCSSLKSVYITDLAAWCGIDFVTKSSNPLIYDAGLYLNGELVTDLVIPEGVTAIGRNAFFSCSSIKSVTIPDSVTSIGSRAFAYCSNLTDVALPDSVTALDEYVFSSSPSLKSIVIPDGIETIPFGAFSACSGLESVTFSRNVKEVSACAFLSCTSLSDVYYNGTQEEWDQIAVGPDNKCLTNAAALHFSNVLEKFPDVSDNWSRKGIQFCFDRGLMTGTSDSTFSPNGTMTRGMFAMVMWNQAGRPDPSVEAPFTDFTKNYYRKAIAWAYETGVVDGVTPTTFQPDKPITREQVAAILYRYTKNILGKDVSAQNDITSYPDHGDVSNFAKEPLAWANATGIITGSKDGGQVLLLPRRSATRAQGAKMLMVFCQEIQEPEL